MATINAQFYNFSKRDNSTKKPTGNGYPVSVRFKETTDLENPTLEVFDATVKNYNYCYIDYTGKYYRVAAIRSIARNSFEVDLREDYLASYIDAIRGQNCYVSLSSVDYDEQLDDSRIVPVPPANVAAASCPFDIVNSMSGTAVTLTECCSLVTETGEFNGVDVIFGWGADDYIRDLANPTTWETIKQTIGVESNPFDNVCEVWVTCLNPRQCHTVGTKTIDLNGQHYEVDYVSSLNVKTHFETIAIPRPSHTDFRYSERFVKYYLKIPFIGVITIPTELVRASETNLLEVTYGGDMLTGQIVVTASIRGISLGVYGTSLKSPIPLSKQSGAGAQMIVNGVGGAIGGALAGAKIGGGWGALAGAVIGGGGGVAAAAISGTQLEKIASSIGSIASSALYDEFDRIYVTMVEYPSDIEPASLSLVGRPSERVVTVKNGYMKTREASFAIAGTQTEIEAINTSFDNGVYVE